MKYSRLMRTAAIAATLGAGSVLAQTTAPVPTEPTAPVVTDVGPRPAEDRNSTGAIVLENSLVRAQRDNAFQRSSARTGVGSIGRGVLRATSKAQVEADLAQARENEAVDLFGRGAGSLTEK
jgi:hypothetical protein